MSNELSNSHMPIGQKFQPEQRMMEAATQVFSAMTLLSLIRPIVNDYQSAILREQQWSVSPKWSQGPCSITGLVLEPARSHLLRDEDCEVYARLCREAAAKVNLVVHGTADCPLLETENDLRLAQRELVDSMFPVTHISAEKATTMKTENYQKLIDLTLRLLAPFVKEKVEATISA